MRLINTVLLPTTLEDNLRALFLAPEFRRDFAVQIEGSGRFSILVV